MYKASDFKNIPTGTILNVKTENGIEWFVVFEKVEREGIYTLYSTVNDPNNKDRYWNCAKYPQNLFATLKNIIEFREATEKEIKEVEKMMKKDGVKWKKSGDIFIDIIPPLNLCNFDCIR